MKTEFVDVNETRKNLRVEIPTDIVNAEIDRVAKDYSRSARIPGFRPGKAPARVIKQRYRDQILHDVAHDLIPRAIDNALRERGVEAVEPPDVRDVTVDEGQPLTFTASFDTVPPFETGDYAGVSLKRPAAQVDEQAVDLALQRLRDRAARFEAVEGRGLDHGDTVIVDLERKDPDGKTDKHDNVSIELGAKANPPGFDEQLLGLTAGPDQDVFDPLSAPTTRSRELANTEVDYTVVAKELRRRVLPELDDEFAKDLGEFETLDALRARVREDLEHEARHSAERDLRAEHDEAAGRAGAVRRAAVARRARARSAPRGLRAASHGSEDRSAPGGHRLGRVPGEPARGRARSGGRRDLPGRGRAAGAAGRDGRGNRSGSGTLGGGVGPHAGGRARGARKGRRDVADCGGAAAGEVD